MKKPRQIRSMSRVTKVANGRVATSSSNAVVLAFVEALLALDVPDDRGMVRHPVDRPIE